MKGMILGIIFTVIMGLLALVLEKRRENKKIWNKLSIRR